ncbi:hypothetical protein HDU87_003744 [Geranomyces variabilis]|uniref:Protein kinase domain-containing protein n=1 Tax=Geranomyces variabilis TaxID=109894 RepID=A0AAD5XMC0_9FUNG|nr:hypothetical protein HDU87_003744 [Geranomyces variabilis]
MSHSHKRSCPVDHSAVVVCTQRPHDFWLQKAFSSSSSHASSSSSSLSSRRRSDRRCFSSAGIPSTTTTTATSTRPQNHTVAPDAHALTKRLSLSTSPATSRKQVSPAPLSATTTTTTTTTTTATALSAAHAHFCKTASALAAAAAAAATVRPRSSSKPVAATCHGPLQRAVAAPTAAPTAAAAAAAGAACAACAADGGAGESPAAGAACAPDGGAGESPAACAADGDSSPSAPVPEAAARAGESAAACAADGGAFDSSPVPAALKPRYIADPAFPTVETELSSVQHAVDSTNGSRVVLKRLNSPETAAHELCILERITAARLPHALALCDTFLDHATGERVLVFPELEHLRDQNGLDLLYVRDLMRQLATGLAAAHAAGIAHLDVTRCNLMLHPSKPRGENLVIIDWGLARVCSNHDPHPVGRGTPGYIAPEMYIDRGATDTQPDVYSAGVILGQWLEPYLPECSLSYLGSRLVRPSTTTFMVRKIQELLDGDWYGGGDVSDGCGGMMGQDGAGWKPILRHAATLLIAMLEPDPAARITPSQTLEHPFLMAEDGEFVGTTYADFAQSVRDARCGCAPRRGSSGDKIVVRYR